MQQHPGKKERRNQSRNGDRSEENAREREHEGGGEAAMKEEG